MTETNGLPERPLIQWVTLPKPVNPDIDRTSRFNETIIEHNRRLHATSVKITDDSHEPTARPFQLWIADEMKPKLSPDFYRTMRKLITTDIADIEKDPFGARSVDPDKGAGAAQERRAVNRATSELEKALGVGPVCVKSDAPGTYLGNPVRENLAFQFETMRHLALQNAAIKASMNKAVGDVPLRFAQVYMALSYPIVKTRTPEKNWVNTHDMRQFLFLEYIPNAQRVEQILLNKVTLTLSFGGGRDYSQPVEGFKSADHPRLNKLLKIHPSRYGHDDKFIEFAKLQEALQHDYGVDGITDIAARNLLWYTNEQGVKEYVVIDQRYPYNIT